MTKPLAITPRESGFMMPGSYCLFKSFAMGKKDGLEMKCQSNSPAKHRPLKPPRPRSKNINQQQNCNNNQIAP